MSYTRLFAGRIIGERPIETGTWPAIIKIIFLRDLWTENVESSSQVQFLFSPAKLPFKSKVARGFLRR